MVTEGTGQFELKHKVQCKCLTSLWCFILVTSMFYHGMKRFLPRIFRILHRDNHV